MRRQLTGKLKLSMMAFTSGQRRRASLYAAAASTLDPSAPRSRSTAKWGIDATRPLDGGIFYDRVRIPGEDSVDFV